MEPPYIACKEQDNPTMYVRSTSWSSSVLFSLTHSLLLFLSLCYMTDFIPQVSAFVLCLLFKRTAATKPTPNTPTVSYHPLAIPLLSSQTLFPPSPLLVLPFSLSLSSFLLSLLMTIIIYLKCNNLILLYLLALAVELKQLQLPT